MDLIEALVIAGGVCKTSDLYRRGVGKRDLMRAVDAGQVLRVRQGVYALPSADPLLIAQLRWNAPATCVTAIQLAGLPLMTAPRGPHLLFPARRSFAPPNLAPPPEVVRHFAGGRSRAGVSIAEVLDTAAMCLSREDQLVAVDAALNRGLIGLRDIESMTCGPKRRRDWLTVRADGSAESPLETLARVALRDAGLTVRAQVNLLGIGRVDLLVENQVIVELDGRGFHSDPVTFAEDRRRDRAATLQGYTVLRFTYSDVVGAPGQLVNEVRAALSLPLRTPAQTHAFAYGQR